MSLSFPASPTNGQIYQNWIWSSSVGAWQPNTGALVVTSVDGMVGAVSLKGRRIELARNVVTLGTPVAFVDFQNVFKGTYDHYEVEMIHYGPVTNSVTFLINLYNASGLDQSPTYGMGWVINYLDGASTTPIVGSIANVGYCYISGVTEQNNSTAGSRDRLNDTLLDIWRPEHPTAVKYFYASTCGSNSSATALRSTSVGNSGPTTTVANTGFRLWYSSGNIAQGTFVLYGVIH